MASPVRGAIDLHVHCGPEGIPRRYDPVSLATHIGESPLDSAVIKSHVINTSNWAEIAHRTTGVHLYGSIVLNHYVGGINPMAVRGALGPSHDGDPYLKVVWLPTVHASSHIAAYRGRGEVYDIPPEWSGGIVSPLAMPIDRVEPIDLLAPEVLRPLDDVLQLVAEYGLILATGHVGRDEIFFVVERAKARGVDRFVITHPTMDPPGLEMPDLEALADMGAFLELCYVGLSHGDDLSTMTDLIDRVGPSRVILTTDLGQVDTVPPAEGLALFSAALVDAGVSQSDVAAAITRNPRRLLSLDGSQPL